MRTILALMACIFLFSGCTREKPEAHVSLQLSVPASQKLSALSLSLTRLMVNVSRPGIPAIFKVLDSGDSGVAVGNSMTLDVPSGPGTLIQVMAVYEDSVLGGMEFYYKDRVVDLTSGYNEVQIVVESIAGASGAEGRMVGRYALPGPMYPTDVVEMLYDPGAGKRPFVLDESEIVGGWFNLFGLDDVAFSYRLKSSGQLMKFTTNYSGGVRTESTNVKLADFSAVNTVASTFPGIGLVDLTAETDMYRTFTPTGQGDWEYIDPIKVVYGFHGSPDLPWTSLFVKFYDTGVSTFTKIQSLTKDGGDPDCTGVTLGDSFEVSDVGVNPMVMTSTPCSINKASVSYAPVGASANASILPSWTSNNLEIDRSFLDGEGNDNLAPFRGGFRKVLSSGSWDVIVRVSGSPCVGGCTQAFNFNILPGTDSVYKSVKIYKSSSLGSENVRQQRDSFDCALIAAKPEFSLVATVPITGGTFAYSTGNITIGSGETTADRAVVLCPADANNKFLPGAFLTSTMRMFF